MQQDCDVRGGELGNNPFLCSCTGNHIPCQSAAIVQSVSVFLPQSREGLPQLDESGEGDGSGRALARASCAPNHTAVRVDHHGSVRALLVHPFVTEGDTDATPSALVCYDAWIPWYPLSWYLAIRLSGHSVNLLPLPALQASIHRRFSSIETAHTVKAGIDRGQAITMGFIRLDGLAAQRDSARRVLGKRNCPLELVLACLALAILIPQSP